MKSSIRTVIAFTFLATLAAPSAASQEKAPSQQEKMAHCAHESKGLKGDERHKFMSECLRGHEADKPAAPREARHEAAHHEGAQQARMKTCNEEAGRRNLHGDERRAFMSACLKG